jgi:site-specific recombinase XerD
VTNRTDDVPAELDAGHQLALFGDVPGASALALAELSLDGERLRRSNGHHARLTLGEAARIIREAVKDKSYRKTPLGQLVGRYLRWFRNEYGATESTIRDYEAILARMSLLLADKEPLEVSTEDLREVIDTWAMRHARTRAKVTSVIRAFWVWAEEEGHVPFSPASRIRRPRAPRKTAPLLPAHVDELLLGCARTSRDRLALLVLLDCGVRRAELGGIRIRDFDLSRRQLTVFGKGQKEREIPLRGRIVMTLKAYLGEPLEFVGRRPEPDDYLLYPEKRTPDRRVYWAEPKKPCAPNTVHRWWYRMLEQAGLVGHGVRAGLNMHRARHTFATELRRVAGVEAACRRSATATSRRRWGSMAIRISATSNARSSRSPRRARPKTPRAGGTIRPPGSTESSDLQERWRRRESNPRPRTHRSEPLQA